MEKRQATPEEARALANPLRWRILRLCLDEALTNRELAARLGRDPGTTLHHVRVLVATGFLRAEEVRPGRRGALERPYRSTGKTWSLTVGADSRPMLALVDAFRDELAEAPRDDVLRLARLGIRLRPDAIAELNRRLDEIVLEFKGRDDPDGTPIGLLVGVHRRPG